MSLQPSSWRCNEADSPRPLPLAFAHTAAHLPLYPRGAQLQPHIVGGHALHLRPTPCVGVRLAPHLPPARFVYTRYFAPTCVAAAVHTKLPCTNPHTTALTLCYALAAPAPLPTQGSARCIGARTWIKLRRRYAPTNSAQHPGADTHMSPTFATSHG